jgi:DNA/RNA endonuclease G (NUC1)
MLRWWVQPMNALLINPTATVEDLARRKGVDENFLGVPVPLPALAGVEPVLLPYAHFSVLILLDERPAAVTGVGIEGSRFIEPDRTGTGWRLDPRLREDQPTVERVYAWPAGVGTRRALLNAFLIFTLDEYEIDPC